MARGFFIRQGDQTTCGGQVLDGDEGWISDGAPLAREGDRVTCGKDDEIYHIAGGISHFHLNGRRGAGTLDSLATCPCEAGLIPSSSAMVYDNEEAIPARRSMADTAQVRAPALTTPVSFDPQASSFPPWPSAPATRAQLPQEPGFHIVEKTITRKQLVSSTLAGMSPAAQHKFHSLNPGSDLIKAGSLIVLSDPNNHQCTREEALLMSAATSANEALEPLNAKEADFMMRHRDEIATFLSYSSTSVGVGTAMYARHLKELEKILQDIEALHQSAFARDGNLRSSAFFAERNKLLAQLNLHLGSLTRKGAGIADHPSLKSALGISSRSLVHHWSKAGAPGQIPGYATHLKGVATASKTLKVGGWIGVGIGASASYHKVQAVCAAESAESCERVRFTEAGSFAGSVTAGIVAGSFLPAASTSICVGIGMGTFGLGGIGCGLVVVGVGSYLSGKAGEETGEYLGEVIYRYTK